MSTHHAKRHCFIAGYYYSGDDSFVMHFTEGEIYRYALFGSGFFEFLKSSIQRGVDYNFSYRRPNRISGAYQKINAVPPGWTDSF